MVRRAGTPIPQDTSQQEPLRNRPRRSAASSSTPTIAKRAGPRASKSSSRKKEKPVEEEAEGELAAKHGSSMAKPSMKQETEPDEGLVDAEPKADDDGEEAGSGNGDEEDDDQSDEEDRGVETLGEGFYEVEAVRKKRLRKGQVQYFIKWRGWPESANTWEPFDNVEACADIIEDFEKSYLGKQGRRGRGKRKSGTFILSQKKRQSLLAAMEDGTAVTIGENTMGNEEGGKKPGPEPSDLVRETLKSPEKQHLLAGRTANTGKKTSQEKRGSDEAMLGCKSESNDEELHRTAAVSEEQQDAVMVDVTVNQKGSFQSSAVPNVDVLPSKNLQEQPTLGEATAPFLQSFGGETSGFGLEAQKRMSNGHAKATDELMQIETDSSEKKHVSTSEGVMQDEKRTNKEEDAHASSSNPNGELGKMIGVDKCTGAKKRKQGFVRRVRQSLDSKEQDINAIVQEESPERVLKQGDNSKGHEQSMLEDRKNEPGAQLSQLSQLPMYQPKVLTLTSSTPPQDLQPNMQTVSPLIKIIKAVNYSESYVDGKKDVTVLFKASRADGCEILVDNKYMRANYPVLLIEFYEKHLRYSLPTSA